MKNQFQKINFLFLLSLIIYIPFQGLIQNFLEFNSKLSSNQIFWLSHWYEPVLLILFVAMLMLRATAFCHSRLDLESSNNTGKSTFWIPVLPTSPRLRGAGKLADWDDKRSIKIIAWILVILGLLSVVFMSPSVGRGLEGFRFTLFSLAFYLFASKISLDKAKTKKIISTYLYLSCFIAVWALIERFFPHYYWNQWHIIDPQTIFGYGWHNVAFVKQSASILGGPNQLGTYLLPAFFISISRMVGHVKNTNKKIPLLYLALAILFNLAVFLTFSRSAVLALLATLIVATVSILKNKWLKNYIITLVVALTLILVAVFSLKENSIEIITHGRSQSEHATAISVSLSEIFSRLDHPVTLLFGAGLGTAGPLALKYGEGIISESWYLQLILEIGVVGLLLWLGFIFAVGRGLLKIREYGLLLGLISVSIAAIFLHTFADNPALTYTLFVLIGLALGEKYEKNLS